MRKLIRHIHLYCGILVSPYLIIYGLSSFQYNHRDAGWFPEVPGPPTTTQHNYDPAAARADSEQYGNPVVPPYINNPQPTWAEDKALGQSIRDAVGVSGWVIGWEMHRESDTQLNFNLNRPSRRYSFVVDEAAGIVDLTQRSTGIWEITRQLHGLYQVPNNPIVSTWGFYTEATTWVVFFFVVTGIYLWLARKSDRKLGILALGGGLALSFAIIFYAWMGG